MGFDHVVVGDVLGQVGFGVEVRKAVGGEVAAVEGGLAVYDVCGQEPAGHGGVAEAARAEVGAQVEAGKGGDWADVGQEVVGVADQADAMIVDFGVVH